MREFFATGEHAEAWKQFEATLTQEKEKEKENKEEGDKKEETKKKESPSKLRAGSHEALAVYRKQLLQRQIKSQRESKEIQNILKSYNAHIIS